VHVKELEYISCLHQTDLRGGIRKDASIRPEDVRLFLLSRYGISVTNSHVQDAIFSGLQADSSGDDDAGDVAYDDVAYDNAAYDDDDGKEMCMDLMDHFTHTDLVKGKCTGMCWPTWIIAALLVHEWSHFGTIWHVGVCVAHDFT
jgi:hypothetical protein